jgi:hypothetical protein
VAPIQGHDAILGMPFLASENILIDAAKGRLILPEKSTTHEATKDEGGRSGEHEKAQLTGRTLTPPNTRTPMIKVIPSKQQAHKEADNTNKRPNGLPRTPSIDTELAKKTHERLLKEYPEVFTDKLPDKPPHPSAPQHRIRLKDENKAINGRTFRTPGIFLNKMLEFIEEHLAAGRIRPSSSNMSAGTWMVAKKDSNAFPRVVHDYRALNENTIKDHTPLPRQDEIMKAAAGGKI